MADFVAGAVIAAVAGVIGGAMNALAGGGTFATLPALIALGLPANIANATSNFALLPGACSSAFVYRDELRPLGGVKVGWLAFITFLGGLVGGILLVVTPTRAFDLIIPWLLLFALVVMLFGQRASLWLRSRVSIGARTLIGAQVLLGIYGGYFGGGVGLITTALYGLLAGISVREMFAPRTLMLAMANLAAALIFLWFAMIDWRAFLPMMVGAVVGGWLGAHVGKKLPARAVRLWTLCVTAATTTVFFARAYG
ncbi:sulfite exporter TauE/SafE family protein [Sphingobium sufflavum]|uniref:sulfite exporter TauE/SafE family protein n=1 Tax=Sphingobium sufflavum TaxID=1129547 RepID=UPI001F3F5B39|nr:sulfite exporter TauE/SafE family protein [Sphingobium sufflavum]MCE7796822.1 sulfite exporter TauE/SafE family protein [Sphingobium sufflavum]